ncbi:MAG: hypothetical protein KJ906_01920 [Nanoarchaeota archaeon]|nr:hypothetical protein [Nanoarchaeota archaeon]
MVFKTKCPHYQSKEDAGKDGFTILPENPDSHWCGDKGEWIENCDNPCIRYDILANGVLLNPYLTE